MENFKNARLQVFGNKFNGGFESLSDDQILKIKGGQRDAADTNAVCTNENDCTKSGNPGVCNNTGTC
ncbi:hypothetical protein JI750_00830 [Flavobacterium sp. GN10]|uniref:Bacteriocin-type signal sequence-containing protein n=1 Tax=Flavobacterium tagetis TaxID=2801336 RepID=A0ABS1K7E8_9FLAO|nr:hypothetical protein [Flavobacterium tagetis]MBL0735414.1 hypothetical protein [Flavobacterium tagetis]